MTQSIDDLLDETEKAKERLKKGQSDLYIRHDHPGMVEKFKGYWNEMKPKSAFEKTAAITFPGEYALWKMPVELHEYTNKALEYATYILAGTQPEAAIATGMTYGLSQAVYGLKTKSGEKTISGLIGLLTHMKKLPDEKIKSFSEKTLNFIEHYFKKKKE